MGTGPSTVLSHASSTSPAVDVSGANCHVKDLKVEGNRGQGGQSAGIVLQGNNTVADDVWVVDAGTNAIYAHTAAGQRISNFLVQTPGTSGVLVSDAAKNVIVGPGHVSGADQSDTVGHSGVGVLGHASVTRDVTVASVHVEDSRGNGIRVEKIGSNAPEGVRVIGCHVDTTGLGDFDGEGINASGTDVIVDGCFVTDAWVTGILVYDAVENISIVNNIVKNSSQDTVSGNHPAIQLVPNNSTQTSVLVANNIGYDDQGSATQLEVVGISWASGGTTDAAIIGNTGRNNINAAPVSLSDNGKRAQIYQADNKGNGFLYPETSFAFLDGSSIPSVRNGRVFQTQNTSATTITEFIGGRESHDVVVVIGDSLTSFRHNYASATTKITLKAAADVVASDQDVHRFVLSGTTWYEV
jgi:hypothetical protein